MGRGMKLDFDAEFPHKNPSWERTLTMYTGRSSDMAIMEWRSVPHYSTLYFLQYTAIQRPDGGQKDTLWSPVDIPMYTLGE